MRDTGRDRGQSETVGFVLVFGVVVLTVALVGVTGFAGLESAQEFGRTTNAEQAFLALAAATDDVVREGAPERATEIRVTGATLSLAPAETTVTVTDADGSANTTTVETGRVVYESGTDTTLTYRSGAVVRRDGASAVLVRRPDVVVSHDAVVVTLVNATPDGPTRVGGTTAVEVRTRGRGGRLLAADESVEGVTLTVASPDAGAWARYFERFEGAGPVASVTRSGDSVTVTIDTERAYIAVRRVAVRLQ